MKVKCIDVSIYNHCLTICKIYEVIKFDKYGNYIIIDDKGREDCYFKEWFKLQFFTRF